jgi:hypothetical protein
MATLRELVRYAADTVGNQLKNSDSARRFVGSTQWSVVAARVYYRHAKTVTWSPVYSLISPSGDQWGGYDNRAAFVAWANRFIIKETTNGNNGKYPSNVVTQSTFEKGLS